MSTTLTIHVHPCQGCGWSIFAEPGQGISRTQLVDVTISGTLTGDTFRCEIKGDRYTAHLASLQADHKGAWVTVEGWQIETPEWVWGQRSTRDTLWGVRGARAKIEELRSRVCPLPTREDRS